MLIETPQHTSARVARVCQRQLGFLVFNKTASFTNAHHLTELQNRPILRCSKKWHNLKVPQKMGYLRRMK